MILLGNIRIYPYGLVIAAGALLSFFLAERLMRRRQINADTLSVFACVSIPLALFFSRLLYCLICTDGFVRQGAFYLFDFTAGGYTMYGAILGGVIAACLTAKWTRQSFAQLADVLSAPTALLIAVGRLGEGLVGQGYGWYVEDWFDPDMGMSLFSPENFDWLLRFPFASQDMYDEWCWAIYVVEALIALIICAILLLQKDSRPGMTAIQGLLMLSAGQILCESLRQDAVLRFGFVRVNQVISALIIVALLIYGCVYKAKRLPERLSAVSATLLGIAIVVIMEFALEKKVVLLESWPMDVCYVATFIACLMLVAGVRHVLNPKSR